MVVYVAIYNNTPYDIRVGMLNAQGNSLSDFPEVILHPDQPSIPEKCVASATYICYAYYNPFPVQCRRKVIALP